MLLPVQTILLFGRSSGLLTHSTRVYRACLLATRPHTLKQKTSFCNRVDLERRGMWLSLYVQMASVACGCKSFFSSPSKCSSLLSDHRLTMRLATLTPSHYSILLSQSLDEASCFVLPTRQSSQYRLSPHSQAYVTHTLAKGAATCRLPICPQQALCIASTLL